MDSNRYFAEIIHRAAAQGIIAGELKDGCHTVGHYYLNKYQEAKEEKRKEYNNGNTIK